LSPGEIRTLSSHMEIGAHTLTHPRLGVIPLPEAEKEIRESKAWIEDCTVKPCTMFCYPKGHWNPAVRDLVEKAGYKGARTTAMLEFSVQDPYAMGTSLHVYPFPFRRRWTRAKHLWDPLPWLTKYGPQMREMGVPWKAKTGWLALSTWLFTQAVETNQPFFHLWGHSAEVEKHGMWKDLEAFLRLVRDAGPAVTHVPNSGLLRS
jgi:peptidoglycan-N-acetylglucosamine deacetylase